MNTPIIPDTFESWKHCIVVECALTLDDAFIRERVGALQDVSAFHTQQFVRCWGEAHRQRVLGWFQQAREELGQQASP